jgi:hypothetical protein
MTKASHRRVETNVSPSPRVEVQRHMHGVESVDRQPPDIQVPAKMAL